MCTGFCKSGQLALEGADGLAVDDLLGQAVVNQDIHVDRMIVQGSMPSHFGEEGFKLARLGAVRWVAAEREDGSKSRMTLVQYPLVKKA